MLQTIVYNESIDYWFNVRLPEQYDKHQVYPVFDGKHNGRHKSHTSDTGNTDGVLILALSQSKEL